MTQSKTKLFLIISSVYLLVTGCKESHKEWVFDEVIQLVGINPLGIIVEDKTMWLTDVDKNRMVRTDFNGILIKEYPGLMRPMHIAMNESKVYVPEFIRDTITVFEGEISGTVQLDVQLDAPAGIDVRGDMKVIADFYNHRVILINEGKTAIIGKEGHADGELNYPTDVALFMDKIFIADAYNNRVQVFDYEGQVLRVIGWQEDIKVATGLAVGPDRVYITDFHGNRVLVYDFDGTLKQTLNKHLNKPADIFIYRGRMYVSNYESGSITVFNLQ